jgi:hypothetical protein
LHPPEHAAQMVRVGSIACERGHTWTKKINRPITPQEGRSLAQREESRRPPSPGQIRLSHQVEVGLEKTKFRLHSIALRTRRQSALRLTGNNCRLFPSKREFLRFCPRYSRLAEKTVKQIKPLPANSRGDANREFASTQPGIKVAEPGNYREDCSIPGIIHDGRVPKENQKEKHLSTRRNAIKYKSICRGNLTEKVGLL